MRGMVCALLASAIGLSSGVLAQPQAPAAGVVPIPSDSPGFVPGQVLVMPARGEDPWAVAHRLETGSVPIDEVETEIPLLLEGLAARGRVIRLAVPVHSELEVAAALSARPDVEFAVPNYFGTVGAVTSPVYEEVLDQFANPTDVRSTTDLDDPRAPDQWHLDPLASRGYIGVDALWSTPGTSGGAVIAVLDSGVDYNHPDLVGRIAPGGYDFVNEDDDPLADHPHGTYVAGAIVANQKNGFQTAGVDRGASIVPVKVISQYLFGTTLDLYEGLMHVASLDHVDIVSMSLVNYRRSPLIDEGLRALRDSGKIVIACAGNGSFGSADRSFPGASPLTISVGATDDFDRIGDFSGTGAALDLVAPGVDVVTLDASYDPGAAAVVSGCSFATPITAGVVASLFSYAKSLGIQLTHEQALAMLSIGAQDNLGDSRDTLGRDDY
ncbi:MAG: S8 family serine peptidase, partial [Planctomycetota bacterium]